METRNPGAICHLLPAVQHLFKWSISAVSPSLKNVLDCLAFLFNRGLSYSTINTARSALSTLIAIGHKPVGSHPFVIRLLKGVFNTRPALPKNVVTWDPEVLLD